MPDPVERGTEQEGQADGRRQRTANAPSESLAGSTPAPSADRRGEFADVKKKLTKARRHLNPALKLATEIKWGDDDRELLSHTVSEVRHEQERLLAALAPDSEVRGA